MDDRWTDLQDGQKVTVGLFKVFGGYDNRYCREHYYPEFIIIPYKKRKDKAYLHTVSTDRDIMGGYWVYDAEKEVKVHMTKPGCERTYESLEYLGTIGKGIYDRGKVYFETDTDLKKIYEKVKEGLR